MPNGLLTPAIRIFERFHEYLRRLASERGEIEEFSAADNGLIQNRPDGSTERFVESGDAGIPVKPIPSSLSAHHASSYEGSEDAVQRIGW